MTSAPRHLSPDRARVPLLRVVAALAIAAGILLVYGLDLPALVTHQALEAQKERLINLYHRQPWGFSLVFFSLYALACALPPPLAAGMTMLAGILFGWVWGLVLCVLAATGGASLGFFSARYLFGGWVARRMGTRLDKVNLQVSRHGLSFLLFLRMVSVVPFFLVNLTMGVTPLPYRVFMVGTMVGMLPITWVLVTAGQELGRVSRPEDIFTPRLLVLFMALGAMALLPVAWKTYRHSDSWGVDDVD
ncbi:MAG: TVP38/TMEM64 family protein [Deltaproteobacteria bacterium]|nr:TVP38/TMEM64 family protein [Deltaproteobacteria bacterium]